MAEKETDFGAEVSKSYGEQEQTVALLRILACGNKEIEQGKFRDAEEVFAELDKTATNPSWKRPSIG